MKRYLVLLIPILVILLAAVILVPKALQMWVPVQADSTKSSPITSSTGRLPEDTVEISAKDASPIAVTARGELDPVPTQEAAAAPLDTTGDKAASEFATWIPGVMNNHPDQNSIFGAFLDGSTTTLDRMVAAGMDWTRIIVSWAAIETNKQGERNQDALRALDQQFQTLRAKGVEPIFVFENTPAWAKQGDQACGPVASESFPALGDFVSEMVQRYSQPPYDIRYWEMWNEPDAHKTLGCWGNPDDPDQYYGGGYYAEMLKVVYPRIKAVDPKAQVLVGGLLLDCDPRPESGCDDQQRESARFLEGILANGGGSFFDGVSFHAYDYFDYDPGQYSNKNWLSSKNTTGPASLAKAAYLRDLLAKYNSSSKYLMNTEVAVLMCGFTTPETECVPSGEYEDTKSSYVVQSYTLAIVEGLAANIWYGATGERGSGLIELDGTPRASYQAYKFARGMLGGATFRTDRSTPGLKIYEFSQGAQKFLVVWSANSAKQPLLLPGTTTNIYDMLGNPQPVNLNVEVDWKPMYIVFTEQVP